MMSRIMGIDASTQKSGVAIFQDGQYITHALIDLHKEKDIMTRIPHMINEIYAKIDEYKPNKILMEETVLSSNTDTLKKLAYLAGGIMAYAYKNDIDFHLLLPTEWRKRIGLKQSKKIKREILKEEAIKAVLQEYKIKVTDDEAESILIARSGFDLPKINIIAEGAIKENNADDGIDIE